MRDIEIVAIMFRILQLYSKISGASCSINICGDGSGNLEYDGSTEDELYFETAMDGLDLITREFETALRKLKTNDS